MVGRKGKGNRMFAKRLDAIPGFLRPWEPVRRTIARLAAGERCAVTQFSGKLGISQAGVSKRIRVLVDAGLQSKTRQGRYRWCRFRPSALSRRARSSRSATQAKNVRFSSYSWTERTRGA